jgi:hypothetical protein
MSHHFNIPDGTRHILCYVTITFFLLDNMLYSFKAKGNELKYFADQSENLGEIAIAVVWLSKSGSKNTEWSIPSLG